jgi:hypothetical protein
MIKISNKVLADAAEKGPDEFLQAVTEACLNAVDGQLTAENMDVLNGNQHTLVALHYFTTEMRDGGFVQLIQNGYGSYVFINPLAKALKIFGANELSKLIYKAREIYEPNKEALERETTEEEFNAMYVDFEVFDDLEEIYFEIEESQMAIIAHYVDEHLGAFVEVVEKL